MPLGYISDTVGAKTASVLRDIMDEEDDGTLTAKEESIERSCARVRGYVFRSSCGAN